MWPYGEGPERLRVWEDLWRESLQPSRKEFFEVGFDVIPHRSKGVTLFLKRSRDSSGIVEAPMQQLSRMGPTGARLLGSIAYGNDIVECLVDELVHTLGPLCGNIDAQLAHGRYRAGVQTDGMRAGARGVIPIPSQMTK